MDSAIQTLRNTFPPPQVLVPTHSLYTLLNKSYHAGQQADHRPAAIFLPRGRQDVVRFMRLMKPFFVQGDITLAIRNAGQQLTANCANIHNGITMDLCLLTGIRFRAHDNIVMIGAGERWGLVYEVLAGGLSLLSPREGFACDNVVNFEIVLPCGTTVHANANHRRDLFLALRGGGNNFGVVTRFDMRTFPQGPLYGGCLYYDLGEMPGQVEKLVRFLKDPVAGNAGDVDVDVRMGLTYAKKWDGVLGRNEVWYTKHVEEGEEDVVERGLEGCPFVEVKSRMSVLKMVSLSEAAQVKVDDVEGQRRCTTMNTTVKAHAPTLLAACTTFLNSSNTMDHIPGLYFSLTLQPYPVGMLHKSSLLGGNSLGLKPADGPLVGIILVAYWDDANHDEEVLRAMKWVLGKVEDEAADRRTGFPLKLMNYAGEFQDPIASYGPHNRWKLGEVSRKWDAEGVFQKLVPGGFKLLT
ncbi:FAD-binding domain-containing protein [Aspergillus heteromorphus CBS 117.55]|uniref:FAD-binding domain-containing protein n=1 Tax=Aspergillus heteromorphus CBS 117.55 TaxID=1448321 RepID=A0A317WLJ7_9EURO|nr:FAD-binding domain-containing protein [Aspergillus heteromorphus CBS 117.55]PWY85927.1 FAD-binding domain-containing protein [Aspergillus heteromorphus CBS 117.55]